MPDELKHISDDLSDLLYEIGNNPHMTAKRAIDDLREIAGLLGGMSDD